MRMSRAVNANYKNSCYGRTYPKLTFIHTKNVKVKFEENCLKPGKVCLTHKNVINLFIVYELDYVSHELNNDYILSGCFLLALKLIKNAICDKCEYSG